MDTMMSRMRRRSVIAGLAALLVAPEHPAAQQPSGKIPRVGILTNGNDERTRAVDAFREQLRDLGYVEGRNIILEFRFAGGDFAKGRKLAAELVAAPVDVIVTEGLTPEAAALTERIPIVNPTGNPVEIGAALSISRPGRNVTGFTLGGAELFGKRLQLLREAFPQISAVSALVNPRNAGQELAFEQTQAAARSLGLEDLRRVEAKSTAALRALGPAAFSGTGGVVVVPDGLFYNFRRDVAALVNAARLPAIYPEREYADDGGLTPCLPSIGSS
jgi:putative ABC transport system substrate-binding protein